MFNRKKRIYEKKGFYILIMSVLLIALGIFAIPWGGGENADASNTAAQTPVPDEEDNWWEDVKTTRNTQMMIMLIMLIILRIQTKIGSKTNSMI